MSSILVPGRPNPPAPLFLSDISVDYGDIAVDTIADLQTQHSWSNLLTAGTGSALVRWTCTVTASCRGGVARALQEAFPDTARTPGGVLRAQRIFQGGGIVRARPGSTAVVVTRTDTASTNIVIPAYTRWIIGTQQFYNRTDAIVPAAGSATVALYRGTVTTSGGASDGTVFQRYVVGTPRAWDVSNDDLYAVDANGVTWTPIAGGLWHRGGDERVFRASTLPDGTVECRFGDGHTGAVPPAGSLTFVYASLQSARDTQVSPIVGTPCTPNGGYPVQARISSAVAPTQDAPPPEFYKAVGPGSASNNGRAVSRNDYRAMALTYDGVIDARFRGQKELNPSDVRWMNIIGATLLTSTPWTAQQWLAFKAWFEDRVGISNAYLIRIDPKPVTTDVELIVGATRLALTNTLTDLSTSVVQTYFQPRAGILGCTLYPSDLVLAIQENATYQQAPNESGQLVDYVYPVHPLKPVLFDAIQYPVLGNLKVSVEQSQRGPNNQRTGTVLGVGLSS